MWNDMDRPWKEAFSLAWEAYRRGTIPIGAVIVNENGEIVSRGRNQIFDRESSHPLAGTNMAHAEMTALFGLNLEDHPNMRDYTLYTTLEPCPMCFGTAVMMNIRNIYYGGDDGFAGATSINESFSYIKSKNMNIVKVGGQLEAFQLILQSVFEYERQHPRIETILDAWRRVNHRAIDLGKEFHQKEYFKKAKDENKTIETIYNELIKLYEEGQDL